MLLAFSKQNQKNTKKRCSANAKKKQKNHKKKQQNE